MSISILCSQNVEYEDVLAQTEGILCLLEDVKNKRNAPNTNNAADAILEPRISVLSQISIIILVR